MTGEGGGGREMKVLLLPAIAFGHLMPFYELGLALAKSNIHVYYFSTPRNLQRLPKVPPNLLPFFHLFPISLPKIPNIALPEGADATVDVPEELVHHLISSFDLVKQPLKDFLTGNLSPDWLIADVFPFWAADVAKECGVPFLFFSPFSCATLVYFGPPEYQTGEGGKKIRSTVDDLTSPPPWVNFPSLVAHPRYEAVAVLADFVNDECTSMANRMWKLLRESKAVAIRTCREIEGKYLTLLAELLGKPVIPVGILPPELPEFIPDGNWTEIFNWLDEQNPKSVVFVGFGSECKLSKEQIARIASGVEESELPFLWSLRKPNWATEDSDALPAGFVDGAGGRGKVCFGWAPQMQILAHPAIGGCLFHSGWGSAIEMIQFGHAMVVLPLMYDQGLNAKLLVEKGLAIEVERKEEDGSFTGKDIAKCLKQAMAAESGKVTVVEELAAVGRNRKLHEGYLAEFVKYLTTTAPTRTEGNRV